MFISLRKYLYYIDSEFYTHLRITDAEQSFVFHTIRLRGQEKSPVNLTAREAHFFPFT